MQTLAAVPQIRSKTSIEQAMSARSVDRVWRKESEIFGFPVLPQETPVPPVIHNDIADLAYRSAYTAPAGELLEFIGEPLDEYGRRREVLILPHVFALLMKRGWWKYGRLQVILRYLDNADTGTGQGKVGFDEAMQFCESLMSRSQFRKLVQEGEGDGIVYTRFSKRDGLRYIHYVKQEQMARLLGMTYIDGRAVKVAAVSAMQSAKEFKSVVYAAFLLGRNKQQQDAPFSRAALHSVTGISPVTQRTYEAMRGIEVRYNYALKDADKQTAESRPSFGDEHRAFMLTDWKGLQGSVGARYVAIQIPNSYTPKDAITRKRRVARANRTLSPACKRPSAKASAGRHGLKHSRSYYPEGEQSIEMGDHPVYVKRKQRSGRPSYRVGMYTLL